LDQANTRLARLRDGSPDPRDVQAAELALRTQQTVLDRSRAQLDAARQQQPVTSQGITQAVLEAQVRAAEAAAAAAEIGVEQAQVRLDQVRAGPTDWDIRLAEEAVMQAQAQRDRLSAASEFDVQLAEAQVRQAQAQRDRLATVSEFDVQLAEAQLRQAQAQRDRLTTGTAFDLQQAEAQVTQAAAQLTQAKAALDAATTANAFDVAAAEATVRQAAASVARTRAPWDLDVEVATLAVEQAQAQLALRRQPFRPEEIAVQQAMVAQAEAHLTDLRELRTNPLAADAQVAAASAQAAVASAGVDVARALLAALEAGATAEQRAVAEAQVSQAAAAVRALEVQRQKMTIAAPRPGIVTARVAHVGEIAAPGAPLLTIADLEQLDVTVFISERDIGHVRTGTTAEVGVDSFPSEVFRGQVIFISSRAEFTPRNIQTAEDRANRVFPVKVRLPNPELRLKPGMTATVRLLVGDEAGTRE
jgi:HlyD family secretion protein